MHHKVALRLRLMGMHPSCRVGPGLVGVATPMVRGVAAIVVGVVERHVLAHVEVGHRQRARHVHLLAVGPAPAEAAGGGDGPAPSAVPVVVVGGGLRVVDDLDLAEGLVVEEEPGVHVLGLADQGVAPLVGIEVLGADVCNFRIIVVG